MWVSRGLDFESEPQMRLVMYVLAKNVAHLGPVDLLPASTPLLCGWFGSIRRSDAGSKYSVRSIADPVLC